jgi:hypothetical protein
MDRTDAAELRDGADSSSWSGNQQRAGHVGFVSDFTEWLAHNGLKRQFGKASAQSGDPLSHAHD